MAGRRHFPEDRYEYDAALAETNSPASIAERRRMHGICALEELAGYYGISAFWLGDEADHGRIPSLATDAGRLFNMGIVGEVLARRAGEGTLWGGGDGRRKGGARGVAEASPGVSGLMSAETAAALEAKEGESGADECLDWVFHAIDDPRATVETAPSRGAWSWLVRLRGDESLQQRFYEKCLDGAIKGRAKSEAAASGESKVAASEVLSDGAGIDSLIGAVMDDLVKGTEKKLKVARA